MSEFQLTSRDEFNFLAELILKHSSADHTFITLRDEDGGTTRFANNQVIQNVHTRRIVLTVTAAFGRQHATVSSTDLSVGAVRDALQRAQGIAKLTPSDPEYLPPPPPQVLLSPPAYRRETAEAGPDRRLKEARRAIELCQAKNLQAAGIVTSSASVLAMAADTGLSLYEVRTDAEFSVTTTGPSSTGCAMQEHRSIDCLDVERRTNLAIDKAISAANPKEMPPGRYTVVLEPSAVAGLMSGMLWRLGSKAYYKGTSPFAGTLGRPIIDSRLSIFNRPEHPDLFGVGFTSEGLATRTSTWVEQGILKQLDYDRFTANQHLVQDIATLDAPVVTGAADGQLQDLIRSTAHGVLVTTLWYIRTVNPTDLTLTGMTRDGTFLIEDGRITAPIHNFRFHESPLRAFNQIDAFTEPTEAVSGESWKMMLPAMKIRDFNFSSVTRF